MQGTLFQPQLFNQLRRNAGFTAFGVVIRRVIHHRLVRQVLFIDMHGKQIITGHDKIAARKLFQVNIGAIRHIQYVGIEFNISSHGASRISRQNKGNQPPQYSRS